MSFYISQAVPFLQANLYPHLRPSQSSGLSCPSDSALYPTPEHCVQNVSCAISCSLCLSLSCISNILLSDSSSQPPMYLNLPGHLPATYCPMYGSLSSAINERKLCCHTDHSFTAHSILGALPAACFSLKCTETALVVIGGLLILNPMKIVFSEFTELLCCFWEFCLCFHS